MLAGALMLNAVAGAAFGNMAENISESGKDRSGNTQEKKASPPPPPPPPPYGARRDLVKAQRERIAKQGAASRPSAPIPTVNGLDMSATEAFEQWISSSISVTHNESDFITEALLIDSYADYCDFYKYEKLDPEGFLTGLIKFSKPLGYLMVDGDEGTELIYGKFAES